MRNSLYISEFKKFCLPQYSRLYHLMNTVGNILHKVEREWDWLTYVHYSPQEITADPATRCSAYKYLVLHLGIDSLNRISQISFHQPTSFRLTSGSLANCPRVSLVLSCSQKAG